MGIIKNIKEICLEQTLCQPSAEWDTLPTSCSTPPSDSSSTMLLCLNTELVERPPLRKNGTRCARDRKLTLITSTPSLPFLSTTTPTPTSGETTTTHTITATPSSTLTVTPPSEENSATRSNWQRTPFIFNPSIL